MLFHQVDAAVEPHPLRELHKVAQYRHPFVGSQPRQQGAPLLGADRQQMTGDGILGIDASPARHQRFDCGCSALRPIDRPSALAMSPFGTRLIRLAAVAISGGQQVFEGCEGPDADRRDANVSTGDDAHAAILGAGNVVD